MSAVAAERPAPLPDEDNCRHYRGTCSGNDPSVRLDVLLCPDPDGGEGSIVGKLQWSSTLSGWNLRRIKGAWSGSTLTFRDSEIIKEKPANGYYFCIIDPYVLEQGPSGTLSGRYKSAACNDDASITLEPVAPDAPEGDKIAPKPKPAEAPSSATEPSDTATPETAERTESPSRRDGCGCAPSLLVMLPLVGIRRRVRR